jgi:hypothetical protein
MNSTEAQAVIAGRLAAAQRRDQLEAIDRLAKRNHRLLHGLRDPWRELEAADHRRHADERQGHLARRERCQAAIAELEAKGRAWWTDLDRDRMVKLERDLEKSQRWLVNDELDVSYRRGPR